MQSQQYQPQASCFKHCRRLSTIHFNSCVVNSSRKPMKIFMFIPESFLIIWLYIHLFSYVSLTSVMTNSSLNEYILVNFVLDKVFVLYFLVLFSVWWFSPSRHFTDTYINIWSRVYRQQRQNFPKTENYSFQCIRFI